MTHPNNAIAMKAACMILFLRMKNRIGNPAKTTKRIRAPSLEDSFNAVDAGPMVTVVVPVSDVPLNETEPGDDEHEI